MNRKTVNCALCWITFVSAAFFFSNLSTYAISAKLYQTAMREGDVNATPYSLEELILALVIKESGGDIHAVGDTHLKNKAYGPLQIRQPCVDDVNRLLKTNYRAEDCKGNMELSLRIFHAYTMHWASEKRLGRSPTLEDIARIWNGGPNGYKKSSTLEYWKDVERILAENRNT